MGIFDKKVCSVCGRQIKLLGNRKLENGNLCKECASKLSPWFSERRSSTVEEIKAQLEYREANRAEAAKFNVTRSIGNDMKLLLDEDAGKFVVTRARNLAEANPDVLDFSQVTGCQLEIEEDRDEVKTEDKDGKSVSYNPPRYNFSYDFKIVINVNHPYFDTIDFKLNPSSVDVTPTPVPANRAPNPGMNKEFREYELMGKEIKELLTNARQQVRDEAKAAAQPKAAVTCPHCGASTVPDANNCCEYCGSALK
ncbi:MAG: DUF4428 domain-containing protein [Oscillospiraceae bacterium]|nr:DUF4428 domain-containing protein [Oscillospiraceae bacterium]